MHSHTALSCAPSLPLNCQVRSGGTSKYDTKTKQTQQHGRGALNHDVCAWNYDVCPLKRDVYALKRGVCLSVRLTAPPPRQETARSRCGGTRKTPQKQYRYGGWRKDNRWSRSRCEPGSRCRWGLDYDSSYHTCIRNLMGFPRFLLLLSDNIYEWSSLKLMVYVVGWHTPWK